MKYNEVLTDTFNLKDTSSIKVFRFRTHAIERMVERGIDRKDVLKVYNEGEVIKEYPDDEPYPSRLMLGWIGSRPIHLVVADHPDGELKIIITVYEPHPNQWVDGFRKKKKL